MAETKSNPIQEFDDIQYQGCNMIGIATVMIVDAWRENDIEKGRRACMIIRTIESLGADKLEEQGTLHGMLIQGMIPGNIKDEDKKPLNDFVAKCYNVVKAIKNSVTVPETATSMSIADKSKLAKSILERLKETKDEKSAPPGDADT